VSEGSSPPGRTAVLGERELAIGFRLLGLPDVVETTPATAQQDFERLASRSDLSLLVVSQSVRAALSEAQRNAAESSLAPLVVFVPGPSGEYEVESISQLAKRVLGVTLQTVS
jgi:V/A-type H+/Na+-transporting ATPase subunit F